MCRIGALKKAYRATTRSFQCYSPTEFYIRANPIPASDQNKLPVRNTLTETRNTPLDIPVHTYTYTPRVMYTVVRGEHQPATRRFFAREGGPGARQATTCLVDSRRHRGEAADDPRLADAAALRRVPPGPDSAAACRQAEPTGSRAS